MSTNKSLKSNNNKHKHTTGILDVREYIKEQHKLKEKCVEL